MKLAGKPRKGNHCRAFIYGSRWSYSVSDCGNQIDSDISYLALA
jgi:hypothetical protein